MGSTLEHGIYLPSEGEKNCYQGLAGNWNKVDGALGDIAELRQLIENKFTKEIVTELPTEDINPFCIYMILKTEPETNNIYDEWVYINNAWEYLGNTQVDMTQYYTKQEVNELPAVASGVTSTKVGNYDTHLADSNIHVTSADKTKWNTVALIKQLRLVNTQVGSATTIAFANIDDTNGIKVGDKCMDLDAKMFEITAVDTTNQTVTVGSALIDLALDANVVHTSGDETVGGTKTFANNKMVVGRNTDIVSVVQFVNADVVGDSANGTSGFEVYGSSVSDANKIGGVAVGEYSNNGGSYALIECSRTASGVKSSNTIRNLIRTDGSKELTATIDNDCKLGNSFLRWSKIYGTEYYYGSNNVEFSTKFVTTDTAQTISGAKTFNSDITLQGTTTPVIKTISNIVQDTSAYNGSVSWVIRDKDNLNNILESALYKYSAKSIDWQLKLTGIDNGVSNTKGIRFTLDPVNDVANFIPIGNNNTSLGNSSTKWKDACTYLINGLTPSSLGMPSDRSARVDISGYFTNMASGDTNRYTAPSNGWIYLALNDVAAVNLVSQTSGGSTNYGDHRSRPSNGGILCLFPVRKDDVFVSQWYTTTTVTVTNAYFIPCQGNV